MYTMWNAPSDRDYYEQGNPPEEEEEEADEIAWEEWKLWAEHEDFVAWINYADEQLGLFTEPPAVPERAA